MSKNVKIKTNRASRIGKTIGIPNYGEIEVPSNGVIELPKDLAEMLVTKGRAWEYTDDKVGKPVKADAPAKPAPQQEEEETVKEEESSEVEETEEAPADEDEGIDISNMNMKELKQVATDADLPSDEWKSIKSKAEFRKYLEEKLG
jgi:hypothetical protein